METFGRTRSSQMNTKTESMGLLGRYIVRSYIEPLLLFFYYISYIGIHCQYDGSSTLTTAAWKQPVKPAIKFYFLRRLCFIILLFSYSFCELIFLH